MFLLLKETSNKDLSTLAKAAFELLKWMVVWEPHLQKAISVILSAANDSNWRTRSATLTYLRTFMYRYDDPAIVYFPHIQIIAPRIFFAYSFIQ